MEFLRQRAQRFGEQAQRGDLDRQFARPGFEHRPDSAENVAQVPVLERFVRVRADGIVVDVQLNRAAHVLQRREACLAHHALEQHASGDRDDDVRGFELLVGFRVVRDVELASERVAAKVVRIGLAPRTQGCEFAAALGDNLVFVD